MTTLEKIKFSDLQIKVEDLVISYSTILSEVLLILNNELLMSPLHISVFPRISDLENDFNEILSELKTRTANLKLRLKLCPGVEPPQIKRIQRETFSIIVKPKTE